MSKTRRNDIILIECAGGYWIRGFESRQENAIATIKKKTGGSLKELRESLQFCV